MLEYYCSKTINVFYDEALKRVTEALKKEGFGVISEIRLHEKLKENLGLDFKKYTILNTYKHLYAFKSLQVEDKIGTILPCNVIIQEMSPGNIEVDIVDPIVSMRAIKNPEIEMLAKEIHGKLKNVISLL